MEFKKQVALNAISNRSGKPVPPKVPYLKVVVVDGHIFQFHNAIKHSILLLTKITMVLSLYCFLFFKLFISLIIHVLSKKLKTTRFFYVVKAFQQVVCFHCDFFILLNSYNMQGLLNYFPGHWTSSISGKQKRTRCCSSPLRKYQTEEQIKEERTSA